MRLCPTVDGSASPLITHRIGVEVCFARQGANFHKCHHCQYRGKAADWEPQPQEPVLEITLGEPRRNGRAGKTHGPVEIPTATAAATRKAAAKGGARGEPKAEPIAAMSPAPPKRPKGKKVVAPTGG